MKAEELFDAMSGIDEKVLDRSEKNLRKGGKSPRGKKSKFRLFAGIAAGVAAAVVVAAVILRPILLNKPVYAKFALAEAEYPKMVESPLGDSGVYTGGDADDMDEWLDSLRKRHQKLTEYGSEKALAGVNAWVEKSLPVLLKGGPGENKVYSPINIYLALGMLGETAGGNTRAQILELLGAGDAADLRARADALWTASYIDDGVTKSLPAASLWLRNDTSYNAALLQNLAKYYHASSFHGKMGDAAYSKAFREWIDKQTDNLLKNSTKDMELDPQTVMALVTTLCYRARWTNLFEEENTKDAVFHAASGDVTKKFMHETVYNGTYFYGERFGAVIKGVSNPETSADMLFILPDEGVSPQELLSDPEVIDFITGRKAVNYAERRVELAVPKFDVTSDCNLREALEKLGVTDAFAPDKADFSSLTKDGAGLYISDATHSARVQIDEEGVKAASLTTIVYAGAMPPPDETVEFVLDRPFLFVLRNDMGIPLFIGIVEMP